jgi:hypothetical protein
MQDLNDKATGGSLSAAEWNEVPSEIQKIITGTDQALSSGDLSQAAKAVAQYSTDGDFGLAGGTANDVTLSKSGFTDKQTPVIFTNGQRLRFIATANNTGAMTINPFGQGVKVLRDRFDNPLAADAVIAGQIVEVIALDSLDGGGGGYALKTLEVPFQDGYLKGMEIENDSGGDVANDLIFNTGKCRSDGDALNMILGSALTKQIDANWATGTAAGGFPSGLTLTASTWYRCFIIGQPDGTLDAGFDTSSNAANLLADATGYTEVRRVGWIYWDGAEIIPFFQNDQNFTWSSMIIDVTNGSNTAGILFTATAPPESLAYLSISHFGGAAAYGLLTEERQENLVASITNSDTLTNTGASQASNKYVRLNSSSEARYRLSSSTCNIFSIGWIDER